MLQKPLVNLIEIRVYRRIQLIEIFAQPQAVELIAAFLDRLRNRCSDATAFVTKEGQQANRGAAEEPLWRVSTAPASGPRLVAMIADAVEAQALYDWGGGLIWIAVPGAADAAAGAVRAAVRADGAFDLYEDDGVSFNAGKGERMRSEFRWSDGERRLTVSLAAGSKMLAPL